jgi:hypothetical protein
VSDLAVNWEGEYALYERPEDWLPELEKSRRSTWILGHQEGNGPHDELRAGPYHEQRGRFRSPCGVVEQSPAKHALTQQQIQQRLLRVQPVLGLIEDAATRPVYDPGGHFFSPVRR